MGGDAFRPANQKESRAMIIAALIGLCLTVYTVFYALSTFTDEED